MILEYYLGKDVRIIDVDGKEWIGHVHTYTPAIDNDNNIADIGFLCGGDLIEFPENEIKEISMI